MGYWQQSLRQSRDTSECDAVARILGAQDYTLLLGMPGTGKSSTIVQAVIALLAAGASVLLMAYTNRCIPKALPIA